MPSCHLLELKVTLEIHLVLGWAHLILTLESKEVASVPSQLPDYRITELEGTLKVS